MMNKTLCDQNSKPSDDLHNQEKNQHGTVYWSNGSLLERESRIRDETSMRVAYILTEEPLGNLFSKKCKGESLSVKLVLKWD